MYYVGKIESEKVNGNWNGKYYRKTDLPIGKDPEELIAFKEPTISDVCSFMKMI